MPTFHEVLNLLKAFENDLTKQNKEALKAAAKSIKESLDDFKGALDDLDDDFNVDNANEQKKTKERLGNISSTIHTFLTLAPVPLIETAPPQAATEPPKSAEEPTQMQKFFTDIAESLIDAQEQLNRRSIDYLKQLALLEVNIPPAYFAIPSVKADLKVGFSQQTGKGVNLIFFNKQNKREEYGESTLSFELVAAPPPPGAVPAGGFLTPIPSMLVLGEKKKQVLQAIREQAKADPIAEVNNKIYENTESLAVVLRHQELPDKELADNDGKFPPRYLVLWPAQRIKAARDFWTEMMIFDLVEEKGVLTLDGAIFESKTQKAVRIGTNKELDEMKTNPEAMKTLTLNLGDSLMAVVLAIAEWLDSISDPRIKPNA